MPKVMLWSLVFVAVGCGGSKPGPTAHPDLLTSNVDLLQPPGSDMAQQSDPDFALPPLDLAQAAGDLAIPPICTAEGSACDNGGEQSLCRSQTCPPCTDTTDDVACNAAYPGTICAGGSCHVGCHDSTTCAGLICDSGSFTCRSCAGASDCPGKQCDTNTGMCVAIVACVPGSACGTNNLCCSIAGTPTCEPGSPKDKACCTVNDCPDKTNWTCDSNTCTPVTCGDPVLANAYYVDSDAVSPKSGKGTKQCPFTSLDNTLTKVRAKNLTSKFTIYTAGSFPAKDDAIWPRIVPQWVELDGTYGVTVNPKRTTFNVPAGNPGVFLTKTGPGWVHGYDISQSAGTPTNSGIYVSNTGTAMQVQIYDVKITGFARGIYVNKGTGDAVGNALIRHNTNSTTNTVGLQVDNGAIASVSVSDPMYSATHADFSNNTDTGIHCINGTLTLTGRLFTGAGSDAYSRTVRADFNTNTGLQIDSGCKVTANYFSASSNSGAKNGAFGVNINNVASAAFTNSDFVSNSASGVHIYTLGGATAPLHSAINFGLSLVAPGNNLIRGNTFGGVCINYANSDPLFAEGNSWNTVSCQKPTTAKVNVSTGCYKDVDIGGPNAGPGNPLLVHSDGCAINLVTN